MEGRWERGPGVGGKLSIKKLEHVGLGDRNSVRISCHCPGLELHHLMIRTNRTG